MSAKTEWEALSEQAQYKMLLGCIVKAAQKRGAKVNPCDYAGDTWLRVMEKLDDADCDLPLLVYRAAQMALQKAFRHDKKYAAAADYEIKSKDGDGMGSVLELIAGAGSVENEAVTRVDFSVFYAALDAVNREIVNGLGAGYSAREIAPSVNMTHTAVNNRVARMREALRPCMG